MTKKSEFDDFYVENINWMNVASDPLAVLKFKYPGCFQGNTPDYEKIKKDISIPSGKTTCEANELFKSLFKMPFVTRERIMTDDLERISHQFGDQIIAHGVEEAKGGMYNLLLMSISNQVRVSANHWGPLSPNLPNISALEHGPYYLIYQMYSKNQAISNLKLSDMAFILVPFEANREILIDKLEKMLQHDLITTEMSDLFKKKLVTYKQFLQKLEAQEKPENTVNPSFFKVTSTPKTHLADDC